MQRSEKFIVSLLYPLEDNREGPWSLTTFETCFVLVPLPGIHDISAVGEILVNLVAFFILFGEILCAPW